MLLTAKIFPMLNFPHISPDILSLGPLRVRWYGVMYVVGYIAAFQLYKWRARKGFLNLRYRAIESAITYYIFGMIIGARLVYALVYNWDYFSGHLIEVFYIWQGGLSFHGAAIGMIVSSLLIARKNKIPFYAVTDALAYCCTPGLFFGRIGNFINAELYGRPTDLPWAMVFPTDPDKLGRHPSQIYQALTEGPLLLLFLWLIQTLSIKWGLFRTGLVGASFLIGYGVLRFFTEFAREPDKQLGFVWGPLSMGQILCLIMAFSGLLVLIHVLKTEKAFSPRPNTKEFLES